MVMKRTTAWTVLLALVVSGLTATSLAQPPRPPRGPGMLLRSDEVRAELELVDDQEAQLRELEREIRDRIRSEMRDRFRGRRDEARERGREGREEMRAAMEAVREDAEARLAEILTESQRERLEQIELQQRLQRGGGRELISGRLGEELGLTSEQQEEMRSRAEEIREEMEAKIQGGPRGGSREADGGLDQRAAREARRDDG